jgi:hypothetical protein
LKSAFCISLPLIFALSACLPQSTPVLGTPAGLSDSFFSGLAVLDTNQNGEIDETDPPIQGATFIARDNRGAEFGAVTDTEGRAFITFPGGSLFPVQLRMEPPEGTLLQRVDPADVTIQSANGETVRFLFFAP